MQWSIVALAVERLPAAEQAAGIQRDGAIAERLQPASPSPGCFLASSRPSGRHSAQPMNIAAMMSSVIPTTRLTLTPSARWMSSSEAPSPSTVSVMP